MSHEIYGYCRLDGLYVRTEIEGEGSPAANQRSIQQLTTEERPFSECARFGHGRLLSALPKERQSGGFLDRNNLEGYHEHLFWDTSGENVGFFPDKRDSGFLSSLLSRIASPGRILSMPVTYFNDYSYETTCYDGQLMRKALSQVTENLHYKLVIFNCQDFASILRDQYNHLATVLRPR